MRERDVKKAVTDLLIEYDFTFTVSKKRLFVEYITMYFYADTVKIFIGDSITHDITYTAIKNIELITTKQLVINCTNTVIYLPVKVMDFGG